MEIQKIHVVVHIFSGFALFTESECIAELNPSASCWPLTRCILINRQKLFFVSQSAFFPRVKNLHTRKTSNGSNSDWLILQMSINQKSGRQTFRRRFVSGSLFVSSYPPQCNFQSETKIEPGLRLYKPGMLVQFAFTSHWWVLSLHSSRSNIKKNQENKHKSGGDPLQWPIRGSSGRIAKWVPFPGFRCGWSIWEGREICAILVCKKTLKG